MYYSSIRISLYCAAGVLIGACASTPKLTHEHFNSHIFANENKQFTYSVDMEAKNKNGRSKGSGKDGVKNGGKPGSGSGGVNRQRFSGVRELSPELEARAIAKLEAKLQVLDYCREGYLLLERSIKRGKVVLRGECNELASNDDRNNHPNSKSDVVRGSTLPEFRMY